MGDYILEMRNITKEFPGVIALSDVNLKVKKGEIHALCGENGAGKSTLMKILSGVYPYGTYKGTIIINGEEKEFQSIKDSEKNGISIIYQELTLVKYMTVGQNIFLGEEPVKSGIIDWMKVYSESSRILKELKIDINPYTKVMNLGIGLQQMVEIAKAISKKANILILDEPTSALTESEIDRLFEILNDLKSNGVTCIYISHKLEEIFKIADSITVLRDGKVMTSDRKENLTESKVISLMVGRELKQRFPREEHNIGNVVFEVKNYTVYDPETNKKIVNNISFKLRKGEILGISGLMGAGRTELFSSIFGAYKGIKEGELYLEGKKITINNPNEAIEQGIAYLSEDRKRYGLVTLMDVQENIVLPNFKEISKFNVINNNAKAKYGEKYVKELKIKTPTLLQKVGNLSGGNQQKVVLAKWLMSNPKVLFLDEPTRGIDVGAKYEIYSIMNQLINMGVCVVFISSELPEILGMSDRILVLHEGKINGEFLINDASQEKIMYCATGGK